MNKQFIITNFAAFALMLFLPTGCRQADGKQDAVQSYRVIKVAASPVEISESYSAAIRGRGCVKTQFYGLKAQKAHSPRQRLGCTD